MQFLKQLEEAYGFHGEHRINDTTRQSRSRQSGMARANRVFMNSEGKHQIPYNPKFGQSAGKPKARSTLFKFDMSGLRGQAESHEQLPAL